MQYRKENMSYDLTKKSDEDKPGDTEAERKSPSYQQQKQDHELLSRHDHAGFGLLANIIAIIIVHMTSVGAFAGAGVFAASQHHLNWAEGFFTTMICIALSTPLSVCLYLWRLRKKPMETGTRATTDVVTTLPTFPNKPFHLCIFYLFSFLSIAVLIFFSSESPRFALTMIVIQILCLFAFTLSLSMRLVLGWIDDEADSRREMDKLTNKYLDSRLDIFRRAIESHGDGLNEYSKRLHDVEEMMGSTINVFKEIHERIDEIRPETSVEPKQIERVKMEVKPEEDPNPS